MTVLYDNKWITIEREESEIPWLKIFAKQPAKEFSDCSVEAREEIFRVLLILEKEMIRYFEPDKINIASFANYLPQVHWHIMARYKSDGYFPETMWGKKQRDADLDLPSVDGFVTQLSLFLD